MYVETCLSAGRGGGEVGGRIRAFFHASSFPDISFHHYLKHDKWVMSFPCAAWYCFNIIITS